MTAIVLGSALALIALAAALAVAVVVRTRRAHRPGTRTSSAAYLPDVTDPRGRWQVTGIVPDLLGPTPYVLNTDHDGPAGTPAPPAVREGRAPHSGDRPVALHPRTPSSGAPP